MIACYATDNLTGAGSAMAGRSRDYFAYLLRCWRTGPSRRWRASLEDPRTGELQGFGSLEALIRFLRRRMREGASPSEANGVSDSGWEGGSDEQADRS